MSARSSAANSPGWALRLQAAIDRVHKLTESGGKVNTSAIAAEFDVNRSTLVNHLKQKGRKIGAGRPTRIPGWAEADLATWVKNSSRLHTAPTKHQFLTKAARIAQLCGAPFPNSEPGDKWVRGFIQRHGLILYKATPTGAARKAASAKKTR